MQPVRNVYVENIVIGCKRNLNKKDLKNTVLANFAKTAFMSVKVKQPRQSIDRQSIEVRFGAKIASWKKNSLVLLLDYNAHQALQYIIPNKKGPEEYE